MQNNTIVQFVDVELKGDQQTLLQQITVSLYQGDFVYVLGGTGSGKSTFLQAIAAQLPIQKGQLFVSNMGVHQIKEAEIPYLRRQLGIVRSLDWLSLQQTVQQNLSWVLQAIDWDNAEERTQRIEQVLDLLQLQHLATEQVNQLNTIQKIKLTFARALLNNPSILLIDQLLDSLDETTQTELMTWLKKYHATNPITIVLATSQYQLSEKYVGDRLLVCQKNTVVELLT